MKNSKLRRILLTLACAVLLVSLSVGATLAYLTSQATVTNTFVTGEVIIDLDEAPVNEAGEVIDGDRRKENDYKLYPAHEYTKDPIVHVLDDSEDCFLFVHVTNPIVAIEDAETLISDQMAANGWHLFNGDVNEGLYVYGTKADDGTITPVVCQENQDKPVFEKFKIADDVDSVTEYEGAQVIIEAYAIQKDMFEGKTAEEIWEAAGWDWVVEPTTGE